MRAPVSDAGCAVGLPYTVFPSSEALVAELVGIELARNREHLEPWTTSAGRHTAGLNLDRFASLLLGAAPSLALARTLGDGALDAAVIGSVHDSGLAYSFDTAVAAT